MGKLSVVGTPIGNLGDISPRALEVLRSCDFIAAEDTRVSIKLLNHFEIKKPMISYYEHNLRERGEQIVARILAGEHCAIVTDAGMPCISDPGEDLVRLCVEHDIDIEVIPGPSALIAALAISGLPTSRFSFEGFLSVKKSSRRPHLEAVAHLPHTLIFYEAPHKLPATLNDMLAVFGDRRIALARELTKLHEEVIRTTLSQAAAYYKENAPRGEFVLLVEGCREKKEEQIPLEQAVLLVRELTESGISMTEAAKQIASETGHKKNALYKAALGN